jgi:TM2 domain-containing membrane protein YozV
MHPVRPVKDLTIAYLFLVFLGTLGVHKFYVRRPLAGALYLVLGALFWALMGIFVGWLFLVPLLPLLVWDLVTLPVQVRKANAA